MNNAKQGFWEITTRFFGPLKWEPKFVSKAIIWFTIRWLYWVFITIIVKLLTEKIQTWNIQWFYTILWWYAFWVVLYHVINYMMLRRWYVDYMVKEKLNKQLLPKFFHIENTFYEKTWTGRVVSIVQNWIDVWASWILEYMTFLPMSLISFLMAIYVIYIINPLYLLYFAVFIIIISLFIHIIQQRWLKFRKQRVEAQSEYTRNFIRNIMSKFEILQSNKIDIEIKQLNNKLQDILTIDKKKHTYEHISFNIWDLATNLVRRFLIFFVGIRILNWEADYTDIVLIITVVWYFDKSLQDVTNLYKRTIKNFPSIIKLREFIDDSPKMKDNQNWKPFYHKQWNIILHNIYFSYDKTHVFQKFNLDIKGSTRTAFVWESWWWKTTLIKLLAWYIKPDKWEISIDWQKLSQIKLTDYYKHIGYLSQDPSVFDWTIHENLVYALDSEPDKKDLEKVIKDAKCEFILEFEKWLETEIWERWVRLSWGQKQRLAIAKIMLKNPNIILLDEPTSALDSFNEELINIALHNLFKWKTVIVVAHRLQTVKQADRILLLEQGKIIEEWTHTQLVKLNGKYKKMLDLQSGF